MSTRFLGRLALISSLSLTLTAMSVLPAQAAITPNNTVCDLTPVGGGTTVDNPPEYTVDDETDLKEVIDCSNHIDTVFSAKFTQTADIDLTGEWVMDSTAFNGRYNGNGFTIRGLRNTSSANFALFQQVRYPGSFENLTILVDEIRASHAASVIALEHFGSLDNVTIAPDPRFTKEVTFQVSSWTQTLGQIVLTATSASHGVKVGAQVELDLGLGTSSFPSLHQVTDVSGNTITVNMLKLVSTGETFQTPVTATAYNPHLFGGSYAGMISSDYAGLVSRQFGANLGVAYLWKNLNLSGNVAAGDYAGGVVGRGLDFGVSGATLDLRVSGLEYVGGIAGLVMGYTRVKDVSGSVKVAGVEGFGGAGGLVGQQWNNADPNLGKCAVTVMPRATFQDGISQADEDLELRFQSAHGLSLGDELIFYDINNANPQFDALRMTVTEFVGGSSISAWVNVEETDTGWIRANDGTQSYFNLIQATNYSVEGRLLKIANDGESCANGFYDSSLTVNIQAGYVDPDDDRFTKVGGVAGLLEMSTVKGVSIKALPIYSPGSHVGGLVGMAEDTLIESSQLVEAGDTNQIRGVDLVGGLVGELIRTSSYPFSTVLRGETLRANNAQVRGTDFVGGAIGSAIGALLKDIRSDATVLGQGSYIGGLVGTASRSAINDSQYNGTRVEGYNGHIGGVVGSISSQETARGVGSIVVSGDYATLETQTAHLIGAGDYVLLTLQGAPGLPAPKLIRQVLSVPTTNTFTVRNFGASQGTTSLMTGTNSVQRIASISSTHVSVQSTLGSANRVEASGGNSGGLAGYADAVIADSSAKLQLAISGSGTTSYGGLVGHYFPSELRTIERSFAALPILVSMDESLAEIGGLVGRSSSGSIIGSYFDGRIYSSDQNVSAVSKVGGLIGTASSSSVVGSYAWANISIKGDQIGGLIGQNHSSQSSTIDGSYFQGSIVARGGDNIGGLAGTMTGIIKYSHASADLAGGDKVGGLIGAGDSTVITASYFDGVITREDSGFTSEVVGDSSFSGTLNSVMWNGDAMPLSTKTGGKTEAELSDIATFVNWPSFNDYFTLPNATQTSKPFPTLNLHRNPEEISITPALGLDGATVGTAVSSSLVAKGYPKPLLALSAGTLPTGLTISGDKISGTAPLGAFDFTLVARNLVGDSQQSLRYTGTVVAAPVGGGASYTGPQVNKVNPSTAAPGQQVVVTGERLAGVTAVNIGGKEIPVLATESSIVFTLPTVFDPGLFDLVLIGDHGSLSVQDALEVSLQAGNFDAAFFIKRISPTEAKVYAKNIVGIGKVQFKLNNREVAWIRALSTADRKLRFANGAYYLVRTIKLKPGKNALEIYLDGERQVRVAHTVR